MTTPLHQPDMDYLRNRLFGADIPDPARPVLRDILENEKSEKQSIIQDAVRSVVSADPFLAVMRTKVISDLDQHFLGGQLPQDKKSEEQLLKRLNNHNPTTWFPLSEDDAANIAKLIDAYDSAAKRSSSNVKGGKGRRRGMLSSPAHTIANVSDQISWPNGRVSSRFATMKGDLFKAANSLADATAKHIPQGEPLNEARRALFREISARKEKLSRPQERQNAVDTVNNLVQAEYRNVPAPGKITGDLTKFVAPLYRDISGINDALGKLESSIRNVRKALDDEARGSDGYRKPADLRLNDALSHLMPDGERPAPHLATKELDATPLTRALEAYGKAVRDGSQISPSASVDRTQPGSSVLKRGRDGTPEDERSRKRRNVR